MHEELKKFATSRRLTLAQYIAADMAIQTAKPKALRRQIVSGVSEAVHNRWVNDRDAYPFSEIKNYHSRLISAIEAFAKVPIELLCIITAVIIGEDTDQENVYEFSDEIVAAANDEWFPWKYLKDSAVDGLIPSEPILRPNELGEDE